MHQRGAVFIAESHQRRRAMADRTEQATLSPGPFHHRCHQGVIRHIEHGAMAARDKDTGKPVFPDLFQGTGILQGRDGFRPLGFLFIIRHRVGVHGNLATTGTGHHHRDIFLPEQQPGDCEFFQPQAGLLTLTHLRCTGNQHQQGFIQIHYASRSCFTAFLFCSSQHGPWQHAVIGSSHVGCDSVFHQARRRIFLYGLAPVTQQGPAGRAQRQG